MVTLGVCLRCTLARELEGRKTSPKADQATVKATQETLVAAVALVVVVVLTVIHLLN